MTVFSTPSRVRTVLRFALRFPILEFLFPQQSETQIGAAYGFSRNPHRDIRRGKKGENSGFHWPDLCSDGEGILRAGGGEPVLAALVVQVTTGRTIIGRQSTGLTPSVVTALFATGGAR